MVTAGHLALTFTLAPALHVQNSALRLSWLLFPEVSVAWGGTSAQGCVHSNNMF